MKNLARKRGKLDKLARGGRGGGGGHIILRGTQYPRIHCPGGPLVLGLGVRGTSGPTVQCPAGQFSGGGGGGGGGHHILGLWVRPDAYSGGTRSLVTPMSCRLFSTVC